MRIFVSFFVFLLHLRFPANEQLIASLEGLPHSAKEFEDVQDFIRYTFRVWVFGLGGFNVFRAVIPMFSLEAPVGFVCFVFDSLDAARSWS